MQGTKPHVALLASPGMGHLIPDLELAKRLVSHHGFKVTVFVVAAGHESIANNSQLLQSPYPDLLNIVLLPFVDVSNLVEPDASYSYVTKIMIMILESLPFLRSHISKMEFRPTALVVDFLGTAAFEIADEFNMLKYVFMTSNAMLLAILLYCPEIGREIDEHAKHHKPLKIPGCKPIKFEDTLECFHMDFDDPFYQGFLAAGVKISLSDGILVNTWDGIEPRTLKALAEAKKVPVYPIGPLVRPAEKPVLGDQVLDWLDKQPKESVIYVSFGSGGTLSGQQVTELAWGLDLSQQRFIWVVRPPTENNAVGSFFTVGNSSDDNPDYLPDGFLTRIQDRGLVVPMWAPQPEILSHPSIGGFLTHCGWNSILESITNGVPMIAWPLYSEQKMNAAMLTEDIGASIRAPVIDLSGGVVGREEIKSMVRRIMVDSEGQDIRARVKELRNSGAKALSKGGSTCNSLSQVAEICIQHMKTKAYGA